MRLVVVNLLQQLGWLIHFKQLVLVPAQQLKHLEFVLMSTVTMITAYAYLPAQKIREDIGRSIQQALSKPHSQSPQVIHSLTLRI